VADFEKTLVGEYIAGPESVATIRIRKATEQDGKNEADMPDFEWVLEVAIKCGERDMLDGCGTTNWILAGTDPGDYRCSKCAGWL
jgi:hypothetical protein